MREGGTVVSRPVQGETLTDRARRWAGGVLGPLARVMVRMRVSPNVLTVVGLFLHVGVTVALSLGVWRWSAVALALASFFDALDGLLARTMGRVTTWGAFLDSMSDRISEGLIHLGFLLYAVEHGLVWETGLVWGVMVGAYAVSYARARGEGVGVVCKVGVMTRMERILVLIAGLLVGYPWVALGIVALLSWVTVVQRLVFVWRALR